MLVIIEGCIVFDCLVVVRYQQLSILRSAFLFHFSFVVLNLLDYLVDVSILHRGRVNFVLSKFALLLVVLLELYLCCRQIALNTLNAVI